jgi:preprotein translocase subunit SecG
MTTVLFVVYIMVAIAMVIIILLQRSEGGALGMGGGTGFVSGRGAANLLTRATAILAVLFFITAMGLNVLDRRERPGSALDRLGKTAQPVTLPQGQTTEGAAPAETQPKTTQEAPASLPELKLRRQPQQPTQDQPQVPQSQ